MTVEFGLSSVLLIRPACSQVYEPTDVDDEDFSEEDSAEYSEASEDSDESEEELGSSEESGKDWSDLEAEAAEEDKHRGQYPLDEIENARGEWGFGFCSRH